MFTSPLPASRSSLLAISVTVVLLGAGVAMAQVEFGCQASGSLSIFPSTGTQCATALAVGQTVDVEITLTNGSSSVPSGTKVPVKLVNTCMGGVNDGAQCTLASECPSGTCAAAVTYTLACVGTSCVVELPGVLTFVPVNADGCVAKATGVLGCSVDPLDTNHVLIFVDADGLPFDANAISAPIATIRAMATTGVPVSAINPCGRFGTRGDTPPNGIITTDARCSAVSTGGAQGSTNLFLPQATAPPTPTATATPSGTPGTCSTSSSQVPAPANALVMPFDLTTGHKTFFQVTNPTGKSSDSIPKVLTHWTAWSESCDHLADTNICLTLNDSIVVDPTGIPSVNEHNDELGPKIDLTGHRGYMVVTAFATDPSCTIPSTPVDCALTGVFTVANTGSGSSFGSAAFGFHSDGSQTKVPSLIQATDVDLLTFDPTTLDDSEVILIPVEEGAGRFTGELGPPAKAVSGGTAVTASVEFFDNLEARISLPDVNIPCALFSSMKDGIIPTFAQPDSSGYVRLSHFQVTSGTGPLFLVGFHGEAAGPFGAMFPATYPPSTP